MFDWNRNGKYDMQDSYIDYVGANSLGSGGKTSSDWWVFPLLFLIFAVCPALAIFIVIILVISGR